MVGDPKTGFETLRDRDVVQRVVSGDEHAFRKLVTDWTPLMVRLARVYVSNRQMAQSIVADAWTAVLNQIETADPAERLRFQVCRAAVEEARRRAEPTKESPFASLSEAEMSSAVDPHSFTDSSDANSGSWRTDLPGWRNVSDKQVRKELASVVLEAVSELPPRQRLLLELRDIRNFTADEVNELIEMDAADQEVLLHHARESVRLVIDEHILGAPKA